MAETVLQPLPVLHFNDEGKPRPMRWEVYAEFAKVIAQVWDR